MGREDLRDRKGPDQGGLCLPWKGFGFYFELIKIVNILNYLGLKYFLQIPIHLLLAEIL